jgi:hypothetical protein
MQGLLGIAASPCARAGQNAICRFLMWCKHCRQDVPGIHSSASSSLSCARCGAVLAVAGSAVPRAALTETAEHGFNLAGASSGRSGAGSEAWDLEQKIRRLQAKTGTSRRIDRASSLPSHAARPVATPPRRRKHAAHTRVRVPHYRKSRRKRRSSMLAWGLLSLGLMALACGIALLVWSFVERRDELWSLGLPIAVGGQVGLLLGLVLQIERVWQNSRDAVSRLDRVDTQLQDLERHTATASMTHGTAAQAFYSHMAESATPQMLLADLQGQIHMLAAEFGRRT